MKILVVHNKYQSKNKGGEDIVYENEVLLLQSELGKENVLSYEVSNDGINGDGTLLSKNNLLFSIFFLTKFKVQIYTIYQKTK